jgi:hypothetical protein
MKTLKTIILLVFLFNNLFAQDLQQVTNNGSTTSNSISALSVTTNSPSLAGTEIPTHIDLLHGLRINGSLANVSYNGITYQSGGGGGAAMSFSRGGSYDTAIDFFTNLNNSPGNLQHRMRIASNGNIGIGTTTPQTSLHVVGIVRWGGDDTNYFYSGQDAIGTYFEQVGNDADKSKIRFQTSKNGNGSGYSQFIIDPEKGFSFVNLGSGSSNVGIGTSDTKGYKLAVNGKIRAQEIKVEATPWPDYVFSKSYRLPTLLETEKHIKENGHLPGIPSATEVKASGIDLGEMNAKLLQKIEELTLYIIDLEKRVKKIEVKKNKKLS